MPFSLRQAVFAAPRRFARDESASLSVEAAIIAPLLLWTFLATYTYFDVFRYKSLALKGNYAISDLLSRETSTINDDDITGIKNVYRYLTQSNMQSWVRVTVVHCAENCATLNDPGTDRTLEVDWSASSEAGQDVWTNDTIMDQFNDIVPSIASGERVIIVETRMQYEPPFAAELTGIDTTEFYDVVVTRPRFAPQLCFEGVGCGA
ncbi:MAG: pilus assembly protein [Alphaproteobacteria bacterium]|nr:MAG: pilus assembly protein [Alphaproteobacteria bacterium]